MALSSSIVQGVLDSRTGTHGLNEEANEREGTVLCGAKCARVSFTCCVSALLLARTQRDVN